MARTITEIETSILTAITSEPRLAELNSVSKVSIWRLMVYIVSVCTWSLEVLFDLRDLEVSARLAQLKPHRPAWYKNKALAFQYGHDLITDSDVYDNTGFTDAEIEASKIIKYCAVDEPEDESILIVKVATETDGKLQPIPFDPRIAFSAYMKEIHDAGVPLRIINYLPDRLYLAIQIYYDPLVLDGQGNSILNGGRPVEAAIKEYMQTDLDFNGELVLAHLVDKLQKVSGVAIPHLIHAESSWIDGETDDYGAIQTIDVKKIPESGYFEVVDFNSITYIANA